MARRKAVARTYRGKALRPKRRGGMSAAERQSRSNWKFMHDDAPKILGTASRALSTRKAARSPHAVPSAGTGFWATLIDLMNAIHAFMWFLVGATIQIGALIIILAFFWAILQAMN